MNGNRRSLVIAAVQLARRFPGMQPHIVAELLVPREPPAACMVEFQGQRQPMWALPDAGHYRKFVEHFALALSCSDANGYIKALQLEGTEEAVALQQVAEANAANHMQAAFALMELFESCKIASPVTASSTKPGS